MNLTTISPETLTQLVCKMMVPHGDPVPPPAPDPDAFDGLKTVIVHGAIVAPYSPKVRWPEAELWGLSRCGSFYWNGQLTDWDRWFDLHPVERAPHHAGIKAKRPRTWAWYTHQDATRPIYLLDRHPDVPGSVAFPRDRVDAAFPNKRFTVSVDWILPFAVLEGFQRVILNGIGTRQNPQSEFTHKGTLYWIGRLEGMGIDVRIEGPSWYRPSGQTYGYEVGAVPHGG